MAKFNLYLNFLGNTEEAFNYYATIFHSKIAFVQHFSELPEMTANMTEDEKKGVMHIALPLGDNLVLMGTDVIPSMGQILTQGNNFSVITSMDSKADADRVYGALSEGGKATMPMADQFRGAYYGMVTDKYGIQWMISYDPAHQQ